jgi:hypothetical protein
MTSTWLKKLLTKRLMNLKISLRPKMTKFKRDFSKNLTHFPLFIRNHLNVSSKNLCLNKVWQLRKNTTPTGKELESKERQNLALLKMPTKLKSFNLRLSKTMMLLTFLIWEAPLNLRSHNSHLRLEVLKTSLEDLVTQFLSNNPNHNPQ